MFQLISNVDKTINLQQYIDNRDGCKRVGLKSLTYTLGWYNIVDEFIRIDKEKPYQIPSGYYSFQQLVDVFQKSYNISLQVDETNGKVVLNTPRELKISKGLNNMLGFENRRHFQPNENSIGLKSLDMAVIKSLYIHLEQLNSSDNYLDGSPSKVLAVIPVENKQFGDIISVRFEHPEFKRLTHGAITELKLEVKDTNNKTIDNHGLPISVVLEIK
jgi:hypothetical protein